MHVSHGILGPGFGDAFPFISPIRNIDINIEQIGLDKSIVLPLALPPITRTAIESARILTRIALSFGDIVTGHFFNYQVNCGHGMNKEQLVARWETSLSYPRASNRRQYYGWFGKFTMDHHVKTKNTVLCSMTNECKCVTRIIIKTIACVPTCNLYVRLIDVGVLLAIRIWT